MSTRKVFFPGATGRSPLNVHCGLKSIHDLLKIMALSNERSLLIVLHGSWFISLSLDSLKNFIKRVFLEEIHTRNHVFVGFFRYEKPLDCGPPVPDNFRLSGSLFFRMPENEFERRVGTRKQPFFRDWKIFFKFSAFNSSSLANFWLQPVFSPCRHSK
jgi:hypothetical protein